ncbi:ANTAR domain-containing protein [Mycolicibacterium grossiae]|uniref:ANTAR domain-containing protein n=1 Tax=Mycolicibacterium grossiae TaxID=1552759 RepID=UPI000A51BE2F|nr:ANTAR domain-containing protein [Mycolicibacterium grossiae]QEM45621.1 ANTAR domain-containing protein [Mycolicibacterium grossiae]
MTEISAIANGTEGVVDASTLIARINLISHATVRTAVSRLQDDHGITDADTAFRALYTAAKRFDVKLRHVAAAVLAHDEDADAAAGEAGTAPALPFSTGRRTGAAKRSEVLADLASAAAELTAAPKVAVHLRHQLHGGVCIESQLGLGEGYRRHFSYVDDAGSAAGRAMSSCGLVRLDDVATSPIYTYADAAVLASEGVRAELAAAMCDETGREWGAVSVLFDVRHPRIDPFAVEMLQGHADSCAQWLRWYDQAVTPRIVAAVHDHARKVGAADASPVPAAAPASA